MIQDAKSEDFDYVLVYKLDRFSRDRYDFAHYKAKLKEHGIKVISATENLTDSPESIILESLLEGMAEYYSKELSQKVLRGMHESAQKRQILGGYLPLGLKSEDRHYVPDPATRGIVEKIYTDYIGGKSLKEIADELNNRGIRNVSGKRFSQQSVWRILRNEKYAGVYRHGDIVDPKAIEPIISEELWEGVQVKLKNSAKVKRKRCKTPENEFLLKGKTFCGQCGYAMVPDSGTGKSGKVHLYYKCHKKKRLSDCNKKNERKELIEDLVIKDAVQMLTDDYINNIADIALKEYEKQGWLKEAQYLEERAAELDKSIDNYVNLIGKGIQSEAVISKLQEAEQEKKQIGEELDRINQERFVLTKEHLVCYLLHLRSSASEPDFARRLIDTFVERVEVFDDLEGDPKKGYLRVKYLLKNDTSVVQLSSHHPDHFGQQLNPESLIVELPGLILIHTFAFKRK